MENCTRHDSCTKRQEDYTSPLRDNVPVEHPMKTVLINRAVPGSGKTTFAKNIFDAASSAGLSIAVPDPARHFNYRWDDYLQDVVRVSTQVKPFDYDILIQITPETYHALKNKIGREIMSFMSE